MIERMAQRATEYLVNMSVVKEEDYEIYKYALICFIMSVAPAILVLSIWFARGEGCACLIIMLTFMALRRFSGGYHAGHALTCLVGSAIALYMAVEIIHRMGENHVNYIVLILSIISLCIFSPIESVNKPLSEEDKYNGKITLIERIIIFVSIGLVLLFFEQVKYVNCIFVGIILTAITQVPCILCMIAGYLKGIICKINSSK